MTSPDVAAAPQSEVDAPRRSRRRWWVALVAVLVVGGGSATFWSLRAHYRNAPELSCACGLAWAQPDAARAHMVQVGPWSADIAPARPGHVQAFEVEITNRSSVTQTVVGTPHNDGQTAEPVDVRFARPTGSVADDQGPKDASDYTATAAVLPPGGVRWVRYAVHTASGGLWTKGRTESFTGLDLKVRIGAWTRWQTVDFGGFAFVLSGT